MAKFELIRADDWEVLLKDGELFDEGHNIPENPCLFDCMEYAEEHGITTKNISIREATPEEFERLETYGGW